MRVRCVVPFCRRTTARTEVAEWICGDHWQMVDLRARRVYGRHAKQWRRYAPHRTEATAWRLWSWIKRQAIERSLGIKA